MAVPLGIGLIDKFSIVFLALMIFAITYGVLSISNIFKGAKNLYGLIALAVTFLALINSDFVHMLIMILPWIAMMILFFFFMFFILQFLGMDNDLILKVMGGENKMSTIWWVFGALIFLVIWSMSSMMGQRFLEHSSPNEITSVNSTNQVASSTSTNSFHKELTNILFNPAILGFMVVLVIAMMALMMLTRDF